MYPISTSLHIDSCRTHWESAAMEVEYLFMGCGGRKQGLFTESNNNLRDGRINVLKQALQLGDQSGRCSYQDAVPT